MPGGGPVSVPGLSSPGWAIGSLCSKCQAQVLNFLPFVRLCCDREFTKTLAAPNNTRIHPLEKFSLSLSCPGSDGFLWKCLGGGGPGLSHGKFWLYFFSEESGLRQSRGRAESQGQETEVLGSHPSSALGWFRAVRPRGRGIYICDPFVFCS